MSEKVWTRPYWHVDAKWIFGLLFSITLLINIVFFVLARLSSEEVAIPVATTIVAQQFSREGLDAEEDIEEVKHEFLATGQEKFYPFGENQNVYLTIEDVNTLSPRELRLKIFRQIVEPIYYNESDLDLSQYGFLAVVNVNTHRLLNKIFIYSFIPLALFLAGFVFFSFRFGRLINPALPLIFLSCPFALFFYLMRNTTPPEGDDGPLSFLPREVMLEVIEPIARIFNIYFLVGVGLLLLAIIVRTLLKLKKTK